MQLTVLTPHRKLLDDVTVDEVIVPGFSGTLEMLEGHANFVTPVETGVIKWKQGAEWKSATISHGILEVFEGHFSIMADVSEMSSEIDVSRAKKAGDIARQKIVEGGLDESNFRKYELKLKRAMARVDASE